MKPSEDFPGYDTEATKLWPGVRLAKFEQSEGLGFFRDFENRDFVGAPESTA